MKYKYFLSILFLIPLIAIAQSDEKEKWDITEPASPSKTVSFTTDEGTWMCVDVSPDGKEVVFDLLGDIYKMPIDGGKATLLRGGHAWEIQPRFSPDGTKISYTSDAGGGDNIWVMDANGSNPKQITKEDFRLLNNAVWMPDSEYVLARKHFTSERSAGAGEIWMYHISGGEGVQIVEKKNEQQDIGEPWVSSDGKSLFYSEDMYPGGFFQYNKDPNSQIYAIKHYDLEEGTTKQLAGGPGGALRPQLSPDGTKMAYIRRVRTKTVLYILDMETGESRPVYDDLSKDQQEAWAIFGVYPGFDWMPDNKNVVIWSQGNIRKINTEDGASEVIPFEVNSSHTITDAVYFKQNPDPDEFDVKVIRNATLSTDEKMLAFHALGYIWIKEMPNGTPRRLTKNEELEFEPSFSPDGKKIAYVSWNDEEKGAVKEITISNGNTIAITEEKGIYRSPSYSPDGLKLVYQKQSGNDEFGYAYDFNPGLYLYIFSNNSHNHLTKEGEYPTFNTKSNRVYYQLGGFIFGSLDKKFCSVNLQGEDKITHFKSKYANQYAISPDGKWLAFGELYHVYIMPFQEFGKTFELSKDSKAFPIQKVSDDAGTNLQWSKDNQRLHWMLGPKHYTVDLENVFDFTKNNEEEEEEKKIEKEIIDVQLTTETDRPEGVIAFTGAKIITMNGDKVIDKGIVIVRNNRIEAVGSVDEIVIPSNAKTYDVSGKVIMPGMIDTHAHPNGFRYGLSPQKKWTYFANLAYGITAYHDPSSITEMSLSQSEMVRSGNMVGPRSYTTGTILYGADGDFKAVVNNYEDALAAINRTKAYGTFSVKSYNQPRRDQRQQVLKAARENGVMVYPEGGSNFHHNMTMILDGHTSVEHNIPVAKLHKDIIQFWGASQTRNTPTLIVCYGAINGEYYWYQNSNVWGNEHLLKYTPRKIIDSRSRHRTMIPQEEYENGHILVSKSLNDLKDNGVKICVGGHGQLEGLGFHWEMWMLGQGGFSNMEALRAATLHGAEYIGMDDDLGSIEQGKLADLIVLDKDPLEDLQNSQFVKYTMVNGRLYDTSTMNEIGNYDKERGQFYWELEGYNDDFEWHEESQSFRGVRCSCGH